MGYALPHCLYHAPIVSHTVYNCFLGRILNSLIFLPDTSIDVKDDIRPDLYPAVVRLRTALHKDTDLQFTFEEEEYV